MSYKVEELLALRDSVSESAVSLDRFADEDVIKEHVLRPSVSANLVGVTSEKPFQASSTPAIVPAALAAPNKKPSPSPSIKRGKAERLLKEHGSPPGMRVTAGGRVVPSDLPPLSTARFGNNIFQPQDLRSVASGNSMSTQAQPEDHNAPRVQVVGNQPVVWIGDRVYALPAYNAPATAIPSALIPPGMEVAKHAAEPLVPIQPYLINGGYPVTAAVSQRSTSQTPSIQPYLTNPGVDLQALKQQQIFKKHELRTVEQTEVLQASHQSEAWRASMIEKKRSLIVELDSLRRQISAAEADAAPLATFPQIQQPIPQTTFPLQPSIPQAVYPVHAPSPFPSLMMYPPPFDTYQGSRSSQFLGSHENQVTVPQSPPGSASRRSHAIEIKPPPRDEPKKQVTSALDPKSPTYEPVTKADTAKDLAPLPPAKRSGSPWHTCDVLSQKASLSSIDTTDFFPTNTHEHSTTRIASQSKTTNVVVPSTPEKSWPASPWNAQSRRDSSTRSRPGAMPSWSETLTQKPSISSIGNTMSNQTIYKSQERTTATANDALKSSLSGPAIGSRQLSDQHTGTDENWVIASNPVNHVPSTYQEGYQAGYDHEGLPDSFEVLQGFVQGMLHSMEDSKKGRIINHSTRNFPSAGFTVNRSASLRGVVSGFTPHDSAVSMTFHRSDTAKAAQENLRSVNTNSILSGARRDPGYSSQGQGNTLEVPISYTLCNETVREPRPMDPSSALYPGTEYSDKIGSSFRHVAMPVALGSRSNGTPVSMQRYYPTPKDYVPGTYGGDMPPFTRRLSGLDGAMDDLLQAQSQSQPQQSIIEAVVRDASCFRPSSSGKGKQRSTYSPPMLESTKGKESEMSSPINASPKKAGEQHSPAKAKLEHVTNKFRRTKKDDPRNMSPEEKREHSRKWRTRFQKFKADELKEINDYVRSNPRKTSDGPANQRG